MTALLTPSLPRSTWLWRDYPITYAVQGSGDPLVLVHGFGASIGHWRHNIPAWAAAGYQVWAVDLLGFGDSAKPVLDYSIDLWVELLQNFTTALIQRPVVWIGNSIGGLISLTLAARYPHLTRGTILLNCAGGLSHRPNELNPLLRLIMGSFTRLVSTPLIGPWLFDRIRHPQRIRATLEQVYCRREAITPELIEILYRPSCHPNAAAVFAKIIGAPPGIPPEELLPQLQSPLLVLWGERDPWTPIQRGQRWQSYVQVPYEFVPLPEAGHCPHDEWPERVNPLIVQWLAKSL
ncbi:MAG: alpha/beta fold hydrolase [Thermostichales cyanobacterium SZTDM-1c_bins_54]